ncbi:hypothetical protein EGW08_002694 [Elysia chlorotica]|uniref:Uncharacterized protein n=1 Tax=Elysia chlorotica TaxID=188477 RepID=A0A433U6V0_ELYCH|nr:hypothetical protein EGW08_002694 [Elysia chlorotica]
MRKSLQRAIPGAMSLPDVMMLDTGRAGEQLSLPDIAKAQSFAGRVSHSHDQPHDTDQPSGHSSDCPYCCQAVYPIMPINFLSDSSCSECIREREVKAEQEALRVKVMRSLPASRKFGAVVSSSVDGEGEEEGAQRNASFCESHRAAVLSSLPEDGCRPEGDTSAHPTSERAAPSSGSDAISSRPGSLCHKHADEASRSSSKADDKRASGEPSSLTSKSSSGRRGEHPPLKSMSSSSSGRSADAPHAPHAQGHRKLAGDTPRLSSSLRSSSAGSSVKSKLPLQQSSSLDVPTRNSRPSSPADMIHLRRPKSHAGVNNNDDYDDDDRSDESNDDGDCTGLLPSTLRTETTTDDFGFSSMPSNPTETMLVSEPAAQQQNCREEIRQGFPGTQTEVLPGAVWRQREIWHGKSREILGRRVWSPAARCKEEQQGGSVVWPRPVQGAQPRDGGDAKQSQSAQGRGGVRGGTSRGRDFCGQ